MNYISGVLPMIPIVFFISALSYFFVYRRLVRLERKPAFGKGLAQFLLVAWFVMFLYVTQFIFFRKGLGAMINLEPLLPLRNALRGGYGSMLVTQFFLNILMCVPLGFLLPMAAPRKFSSFPAVLAVSFLLTMATEVSQFFTGRSTDIDDVIANTLGGVLGFSIFVLFCGFRYLLLEKKDRDPEDPPVSTGLKRYPLKLAVSLLILLLCGYPFAAVKILQAKNELGVVPYSHFRPSYIENTGILSGEEGTAEVYRFARGESRQALEDRLKEAAGMSGQFETRDGTAFLSDGEKTLSIDRRNRWSFRISAGTEEEGPGAGPERESGRNGTGLHSGEDEDLKEPESRLLPEAKAGQEGREKAEAGSPDPVPDQEGGWEKDYPEDPPEDPGEPEGEPEDPRMISQEQGLAVAYTAMLQFGISREQFRLESSRWDPGKESFFFLFRMEREEGGWLESGPVSAQVGGNGRLLKLHDGRLRGKAYRTVRIISQKEAVAAAAETGSADWKGTAVLESVEASHYFNEDTGFFIPAWQIRARFTAKDGVQADWCPAVSAIKQPAGKGKK